jgi:hypothetical protein
LKKLLSCLLIFAALAALAAPVLADTVVLEIRDISPEPSEPSVARLSVCTTTGSSTDCQFINLPVTQGAQAAGDLEKWFLHAFTGPAGLIYRLETTVAKAPAATRARKK